MSSLFCLIAVETGSVRSMHGFPGSRLGDVEENSSMILDDWTLQMARKDVQVCTRWIISPRKIEVRQVKGTIRINVKREQVARSITEVELARKWMDFMDELNYYKNPESPGEWFAYGRINVMGKLACFDVVTRNRVLSDPMNNKTLISMNDTIGYLPDKPGVYRIHGVLSFWNLITIGPDETVIELILCSDMDPVIPTWMTDPVVYRLMVSTLNHLKERLQEKTRLPQIN